MASSAPPLEEPRLVSIDEILPGGYGDAAPYLNLTEDEARRYARHNYKTPSAADLELAAQDIDEMIADEDAGKNMGVQIAPGTGTNLMPAIAAAGHMRQVICFDPAKANKTVMGAWIMAAPGQEEAMWEGWRKVIGMFEAKNGNAQTWLNEIKAVSEKREMLERLGATPEQFTSFGVPTTQEQDIYWNLRHWDTIGTERQDEIVAFVVPDITGNVYLTTGSVPELLRGKVTYFTADNIRHVNGNEEYGLDDLQPWVGRGDRLKIDFVEESVTKTLAEQAVAAANNDKLLSPDGRTAIRRTSRGLGYAYSDEGMGELSECYQSELACMAFDEQRMEMRGGAAGITEHKLRTGYGNFFGYVGDKLDDHPKQARELLARVMAANPDMRIVNVALIQETPSGKITRSIKPGYCFRDEIPEVAADITRGLLERYPDARLTITDTDLQPELDKLRLAEEKLSMFHPPTLQWHQQLQSGTANIGIDQVLNWLGTNAMEWQFPIVRRTMEIPRQEFVCDTLDMLGPEQLERVFAHINGMAPEEQARQLERIGLAEPYAIWERWGGTGGMDGIVATEPVYKWVLSERRKLADGSGQAPSKPGAFTQAAAPPPARPDHPATPSAPDLTPPSHLDMEMLRRQAALDGHYEASEQSPPDDLRRTGEQYRSRSTKATGNHVPNNRDGGTGRPPPR